MTVDRCSHCGAPTEPDAAGITHTDSDRDCRDSHGNTWPHYQACNDPTCEVTVR